MRIYTDITQLIGKTPLIDISDVFEGIYAKILIKLESQNPGGSVKDRLALSMITNAEKLGQINQNSCIIEPSSGNTGVGLAMICAARKYRLIITMPESMSVERRKILTAYGAELVLTPADKGMKGAIAKAEELKTQISNSIILQQFENQANPQIHRETTAIEILSDTEGKIDIFVAGVGTGGTITGVGEILKNNNPNIEILAVEPADSPILSGGNPGPHKIQGIGAGFIPKVLNTKIFDDIIKVQSFDAFETARQIAKHKGILCGISSGANIWAAKKIAENIRNKDKTIVTIVCDTGERYLSTDLFQ